ncbi:Negative elongation factor D, partial [Fragariocoptes setiger]
MDDDESDYDDTPGNSPRIDENDDGSEEDDEKSILTVRRECEEILASTDFIMEPGIVSQLKRYFQAEGNPETVVDLLSENYTATAQMVNLLAEWLILTGMEVDEVQNIVEDHLKQMVIKHFDPKKADTIFNDDASTPSWLTEMIGHPSWRSLIYKLAEMYPDCLMLIFTIKLISDAGFQGEITSISTASQQLEVFARILKTSIVSILEGNEEDVEKNLNEFCKMVCHAEHTYLYSQAILHVLARESKNSANIRRLAQEVAKYAQNNGHDATPITMSLMGGATNSKVFRALSSMLSRNMLNPADVTLLYKEYFSSDPPSVALIRVPQFLDLLLESLFKPGSRINPEHKPKYIYLLAYAASVVEHTKKGNRKSSNKEQLEHTLSALERVATICQEKRGSTELSNEVATLYSYLRIPVVAMGILLWVKNTVTEPNYFQLSTEHTPIHLAFLDEISSNHNTLHGKVLELLISLMEYIPEDMEDLQLLQMKRVILDRMVHLVSRHCVVPVMSYIRRCWKRQDTDVSLIRYFVTEVLEIIGPPYTQEFINMLLPLIEANEITGNLRNENKEQHQLVTNFLTHIR